MRGPAPVPTCWLHLVYVPLMGSVKKRQNIYHLHSFTWIKSNPFHEYFGSNSTPPEVWQKKTPKVFFSKGTKARVKAAATAPIIDATKMKKGKSIQSQSCMKIRFEKNRSMCKVITEIVFPKCSTKKFSVLPTYLLCSFLYTISNWIGDGGIWSKHVDTSGFVNSLLEIFT